ncbi:MAG: TetR/AcrR family transcriptional regulator [Erysipelotrichia bacterium]|nr:TetR/AcrR family transcriptional regulator [Erysipelotrichia bacterium]
MISMDYEAFGRLPLEKQSLILDAGINEFSVFSYSDANTDRITAACGISKGLLFHYFGTKKEFYLYCLERSLQTLTDYDPPARAGDFYTVLFAEMENKIRLCADHPCKTNFINLASRESAAAIMIEKNELLKK